jgi:HPt (histidine-containing phosphotransfer) domain-containing protein
MTATPSNATPLLDIDALNDLKDMLAEALTEIADTFLDGLDAEVEAVSAGIRASGPAARAAAHSLKGSAGNLGGRALAMQASAIEKAAVDGDLATCEALYPALQTLAGQTREALKAYLAQP